MENPEDILRKVAQDPHDKRFSYMAGRFYAGREDASAIHDLKLFNRFAQAAGVDSQYVETDGGHNFLSWREAFSRSFDFIIRQSGVGAKLVSVEPEGKQEYLESNRLQ